MNLNELWSGTDYAYYPTKGRGELYRSTAQRVKIIRVFKEKLPENQRLSGFAEILYCDRESGEPLTYSDTHYDPSLRGKHQTGKIRARDIAMRWEEYAELHAARVAKLEQEERERREYRQRLEDERQRLKELEEWKKQRVKDVLIQKYGLPASYVMAVDNYNVYISRAELEKEIESAPIQ